MATQFTLFPDLIPELRLMIWRLALPTSSQRLLYPYKHGCWTCEDFGLGPDANIEDLYLQLDTSLLEPLRVELPLYAVNREARDVTLEYFKRHKVTVQRSSNGLEVLRPFDPRSDTVFLPTLDMERFIWEAYNRLAEPEPLDSHVVDTSKPALPRLAVTTRGLDWLKTNGMPLDIFLHTRWKNDCHTICVLEPACWCKLQELETAREIREFSDEPLARVTWGSVRGEWEGASEAGDEEALVRLKGYVEGLDSLGDSELEVQLVHLAMPEWRQ